MSFEQSLGFGKTGESRIARWLRSRGTSVLPVYEKIINEGKGPQLFTPNGSLIAPDMFCFNGPKCSWIEAKHKSAFSWDRTSQQWVTGIDLRHYFDYLKVQDSLPHPVWLFFLHESGTAKDSPQNGPTGLFAESIQFLRLHEHHRSDKYSKGMVYWSHSSLRKLVSLQQLPA